MPNTDHYDSIDFDVANITLLTAGVILLLLSES